MRRRNAPDSPDWAAAALDDFLHVLRKLAWTAGLSAVAITMAALAIALADLRAIAP